MAPPGEVGSSQLNAPGGSHCSPGSRIELPQDDGSVVLVLEVDELVTVTVVEVLVTPGMVVVDVVAVVAVVGGAVLVVVVPPPAQPELVHASQQLEKLLTHALPPFGGSHLSALFFALQRVLPCLSVRQHVTVSPLPQVDLIAQVRTRLLQLSPMRPSRTASFTTLATQLTCRPWLDALAQSHCAAASARTEATAASSQGPSPSLSFLFAPS